LEQPIASAAPQRSLAHYLQVIRRNWLLVIVPAVLAAVVAFLLSSQSQEIYESTSTVRVAEPLRSTEGGPSAAEVERQLGTSVAILTSAPMRRAVLDEVSSETAAAYESVSAEQVGETSLIDIEVRATDGAASEELAQQWAETFVEREQAQDVAGLTERATALRLQADELQPELDELDAQIAAVNPVAGQPTPLALTTLLAERQALLNEQIELRSNAIDFEVEAALREGAVALAVPASNAGEPVEPKPLRTALFAGVLGLLVGLGLALLRDELDTRVRGRDDLRDLTPDLPLLGAIPFHRHGADAFAALRLGPEDSLMEAFRALGTNIEFMEAGARAEQPGRARIVLITSPAAGDGKTSTTANLGLALASIGKCVVLISGDLRDPDLHEAFRASAQPGVVDVVVDGADRSLVVQEVATGRQRDLELVASGRRTSDPVGVLSSDVFGDLVESLAAGADYVLIDAPPVLAVTDALVAGRLADTTILVVADGRTQRRAIQASLEALRQVGCPVLGTVLTRAAGVEPVYGPAPEPEPAGDRPAMTPADAS
jgi:capsular exopolysaccharide synthesis family protein